MQRPRKTDLATREVVHDYTPMACFRDIETGTPELRSASRRRLVRISRLQGQRGAIEAGQFADIIATTENPLQDIQTLRRTNFVMKNGAVIRHDGTERPSIKVLKPQR